MLDSTHFGATLVGATSLLPFGKTLDEPALLLAWQTFPAAAKAQLTNEQWTYAIGQYLLDPDRPREQPIHLAALRYVFRLENGTPNFTWGLRGDLQQRMANPGQFQPLPIPLSELPPAADDRSQRYAPHGVLSGRPLPLRALGGASNGHGASQP